MVDFIIETQKKNGKIYVKYYLCIFCELQSAGCRRTAGICCKYKHIKVFFNFPSECTFLEAAAWLGTCPCWLEGFLGGSHGVAGNRKHGRRSNCCNSSSISSKL